MWLFSVWALTHLPPVSQICVGEPGQLGSGDGFSPVWRQAITWSNVDLLSIGALGTNFSEILNRNTELSIDQNAFENVCEIATN